jgi:hypothetical protein
VVNHIAGANQLHQKVAIENGIDMNEQSLSETGILFQNIDIIERACGKIIDNINIISLTKKGFRQMGAYKSGATRD